MKPVSEPCLRNQQPITDALTPYLQSHHRWLELGSGTGQHGVYIAQHFPEVVWQLTDLADAQEGLRLWQTEAALNNLPPPQPLDVTNAAVSGSLYDGVFTANTIHFVSWQIASALIQFASASLITGGIFGIYGPFNEKGRFTGDGNARLDAWLKGRDPTSGIKDRDDIAREAQIHSLTLEADMTMPANNRILVFRKV